MPTQPLHFLLTNDDGFDAEGLASLAAVAAEFGRVSIAAPATQQSYVGHRVTTHDPLALTPLAPDRFHLAGTPADCIRVAVAALGLRPDWVLSGINHGGNLGADVYTSGTVAGAREAALLGLPAVAFSQFHRRPYPWDWAASRLLVYRVISRLLAESPLPGRYWSANLPHPVPDPDAVELVETHIDPNPLDIRYRRDGDLFFYDGHYADRPRHDGADVDLCFAGKLTLTSLHL